MYNYKAGEIVLSSNDETPRDSRSNTGRVYLFKKQFTGYIEPENMLVALKEQAELHEARQSDEQVHLQYLMCCNNVLLL